MEGGNDVNLGQWEISGNEDISLSSIDEIDNGIETRNVQIEQVPKLKRKRGLDSISCDSFGVPLTPKKRTRVFRPGRERNKAIIVTSVLAQMLFAHTQTVNAF